MCIIDVSKSDATRSIANKELSQRIATVAEVNLNVPAIEKLVDYSASGIGAVAGPLLAPWRAGREGKARVVAAHADAESHRINTESDAESLRIIAAAQSEARQHLLPSDDHVGGTVEIGRNEIFQRIEFQEQKRLANISSVVNQAASELHGKEVPNDDPDPDWTARFFDCVQDVSSEEMRSIWARILSGEVESPGRTSLRTLDTLRNLTKEEAELFRNICDFVIGHDFLFYEDSSHSAQSKYRFDAIRYGNLLRLQDYNLVSVEPGLGRSFELKSGSQLILDYQNDGLVIVNRRGQTSTVNIPIVRLTTSGISLGRFIQCNPQMEYLETFAAFLNGNHCQLNHLESMIRIGRGRIDFARSSVIGKTLD